jgi:alpha-L-fucosidase
MQQGGTVTVNMGIYQDGTVDENALQVMKDVAASVRK